MRIGELARRAGITTDTIRFYEKQGLLDESVVDRRANNYRDFSVDALDRLTIIEQAKGLGFSLSEIRRLAELWSSGEVDDEDRIRILRRKLDELAAKKRDIEGLEQTIHAKLRTLTVG